MRDAMKRLGGDPSKINPLQPVELVIDHSVQVDEAGTAGGLPDQRRPGVQRNRERYAFLRWGQDAFHNFRVVPPDTGIVHQVNLEYLARVVFSSTDVEDGEGDGDAAGLSRHAGRHRLAHDDDQRPGRARLGRRRDRGRGGDARPAGLDARAAGRRLQARRRPARGGDGDRPGPDRHRDAAPQGGGRQVRRVLRRRPGEPAAGRPRHDRQHGPRVRRDLRHLPDRRRDAPLPRALRPPRVARPAGRGVLPGAGALPRRSGPPRRNTPTRSSSTWRPSSPAWPARSGRRTASRCTRRRPRSRTR